MVIKNVEHQSGKCVQAQLAPGVVNTILWYTDLRIDATKIHAQGESPQLLVSLYL